MKMDDSWHWNGTPLLLLIGWATVDPMRVPGQSCTSDKSSVCSKQPPESSRHQFHHAPQTTPRLENFRIFFHVLTQDHSLADLIWSQQTRQELRAALEHEIQYIERQQEARGAQNVAWNHQQFKVDYPSLDHKVKVGSVYMRLWLQAGNGFIQSWQDPVRLLELLFRRFLCELDRNQTVAVMCIQCLERLYVPWRRPRVLKPSIDSCNFSPHCSVCRRRTRRMVGPWRKFPKMPNNS